jgi:hypothetical protein
MAERAAGEAAKGEAMMHEARKGDFLSRAGPSTVRTQRLNEKEFLADVLRPFHDAIVKALAPHFHDVFEGEDPADDPELIHYAIDLIHDAGRPFGTFIDVPTSPAQIRACATNAAPTTSSATRSATIGNMKQFTRNSSRQGSMTKQGATPTPSKRSSGNSTPSRCCSSVTNSACRRSTRVRRCASKAACHSIARSTCRRTASAPSR